MPTIIIAPSEPRALKALGPPNHTTCPESKGVDVAWCVRDDEHTPPTHPPIWWGVQRKQFPGDFLASTRDGRLNKEFAQMSTAIDVPFLLLEGYPNWTIDGEMFQSRTDGGRGWNQVAHAGFLASVQVAHKVHFLHTSDLQDTVRTIQALINWSQKTSHDGLNIRPKERNPWASGSNPDWQIHALQSIPGIGPGVAREVIKHFGYLPILWTVSVDDLAEVRGIGPKRAKMMKQFFCQTEPLIT